MMTNVLNIIGGVLICTTCSQPMKSTGIYSETLLSYPSPAGHKHDDNCKVFEYKCTSNSNHIQFISIQRTCSMCDWKGRETCFCHALKKVKELPTNPK